MHSAVLVEIQGDMAIVEAVDTVVLEDMVIVEAVGVTIIVAGEVMGIVDLVVNIVDLVVDIVEADIVEAGIVEVEDMDIVVVVVVDIVHIVAVDTVVVEVTVEIITVVVENMGNVTIAMFIKILDTNQRENQDLMDIHLQTLNANTKKKLYMLQRPNINLRKNALPFSPPVAGRNMLRERESDLRRNAMNLA